MYRVLRGGSWNNNPRNARSANRNNNTPDNRNNNIGFRVASTALRRIAAGDGPSRTIHGFSGSAVVQSRPPFPCRPDFHRSAK